jgi:hypothetical protein
LVGGSIDLELKAYHRSDLRSRRGPRKWNAFVEGHPAGSWWHTEEWLDYCLDYEDGVSDLSFALVNEGKVNRPSVVGICPAIKKGNTIRMGHDPCAGPLVTAKDYCVEQMNSVIKSRLGGCEVEWRWNRHPVDYRNMIVKIAQAVTSPRYLSWNTAILPLSSPVSGLTAEAYTKFNHGAVVSSDAHRWRGIRKSYKSLIRHAEEKYSFLVSRPFTSSSRWSLWDHYVACHQACATRPRSAASYRHQLSWIKKGLGDIFVAFPRGGLDHSVEEFPGRVTSSLPGTSTGGSSPSPSTIVAAAYVLNYKGRHYYASGPSRLKNVQHALQWRIIQHLAHHRECSLDYELGWIDKVQDDSFGFFKSGFGGELRGVDCVTGRIADG